MAHRDGMGMLIAAALTLGACVAETLDAPEGELAFRQHFGGHENGPNWPCFLDFAERYFEPG